jgi:NAD(P)-dependent dehydrogenase (short-subunit alcohol dehydrogenase family)
MVPKALTGLGRRARSGAAAFFMRETEPAPADVDLTGRVVAITGAARGIGAGLARALAGRGARVALLGLEPAELAKVAADCGEGAAWWEVDVTDGEELAKVALGVVEHFGGVDVAVANAGIAAGGPVALADPTSFDRIIEVNLLGSVRTARAFLPYLMERHGYYLQIASLAAIAHSPMLAAYCTSKAGVEAFADCLRAEVAHHGVAVGVAYLTWTDTDMVRGGDEVEGMAGLRATAPFPFNRTYPLEPVVDRLVAGIATRAARVYAPRWVSALLLGRGMLPASLPRSTSRRVAAVEEALRVHGTGGSHPVGAGGQADTREGARVHRPG